MIFMTKTSQQHSINLQPKKKTKRELYKNIGSKYFLSSLGRKGDPERLVSISHQARLPACAHSGRPGPRETSTPDLKIFFDVSPSLGEGVKNFSKKKRGCEEMISSPVFRFFFCGNQMALFVRSKIQEYYFNRYPILRSCRNPNGAKQKLYTDSQPHSSPSAVQRRR